MNRFYIGLHHPSTAWPFDRCMVSVNALKERRSNFWVNDWIMDSGGFTELANFGRYRLEVDDYIEQIDKWQNCGNLQAAVSQDWMCEPYILSKTGLSVEEHQDRTIERYVRIIEWVDETYVMPVLQGFSPASYASHVRQYGRLLTPGQWVGVGSVCKRNGTPDAIEDVLLAIKRERPDLQLHGFGIKLTALERASVRELLYSCDSMAWSFASRMDGSANDPREALRYAAKVESLIDSPTFIQDQLYAFSLSGQPSV